MVTLQTGAKPSRAMPLPVRVLAILGIAPFAVGALAVSSAPEIKPEAAHALLIYGAVILSFLGGIRFGIAMLDEGSGWNAFGMSTLPALAAWLGASAAGPGGLVLLAAALGAWYFVERAAPPSFVLPAWYLRLRGALTVIATLTLIAAAVTW
jgi:hypothetical protein